MLKALFHTFLAFPIWEKVITRGNQPVTAAYSPIKVWSEAQLKEKRSQDHFEKKKSALIKVFLFLNEL